MRPENRPSLPLLPLRPRFSWDIKTVPWTDGRGDQTEFADAVRRWQAFHANLPDGNSNKISASNQGIVLLSHLYGRARDLCKAIPDDVIHGKGGVDAIVSAIHKRDPLTVVSMVYGELLKLMSTKRNQNESFRDFELRFNAQLSRFNSLATHASLTDSISALMLLAKAAVDSSQRVSILAAAPPSADLVKPEDSTDSMLQMVGCESVATVLRQCDNNRSNGVTVRSISSSSATVPPPREAVSRKSPARQFNRMTRLQVLMAKNTSPCKRCGHYVHWYRDHNDDGSLPSDTPNSSKPIHSDVSKPPEQQPVDNKAKNNPRVLKFNTATVAPSKAKCIASAAHTFDMDTGPLVDSGAPYSAIGIVELAVIAARLLPKWNGILDPVPSSLQNCQYWQYGVGDHASEARRIIGSISLPCYTNDDIEVSICHLVLDGSSQWVIGQNVTEHCDICQIGSPELVLQSNSGTKTSFTLVKRNRLLYMLSSCFGNTSSAHAFSTLSASASSIRSRSDIRAIIDRVHKHVCGHSNFSDMKTLLERNHLWSSEADDYLQQTIANCRGCRSTSLPQPSRKVSISNINRSFYQVICLDHMYLGEHCVLHIMDAKTRLSAGVICIDTSLSNAIYALQTGWLTPFWTPASIRADDAFNHAEFVDFVKSIGSQFEPIPPRRHQKNVLESKHGILRSIFIRLSHDTKPLDERIRIALVFDVSNQLYGSEVMSAYEMAHGFTKPLTDNPTQLPSDLIDAQLMLDAKRKMTRILRSKSPTDIAIAPGDLVEVFVKHSNQKRGSWSSPRIVLDVNTSNGSITVPGSHGRTMKAALEDVRMAISNECFALVVREANDTLDRCLDYELNGISDDDTISTEEDITGHKSNHPTANDTNNKLPPDNEPVDNHQFELSFASDDTTIAPVVSDNAENIAVTAPLHPAEGDQIEVFWPLDNTFYSGVIAEAQDGFQTIVYEDGGIKTLDFPNEIWRYASSAKLMSIHASSIHLNSDAPIILDDMLRYFGNKPFLRHEAQAFPNHVLHNAYSAEELDFKKTVRITPLAEVPNDANIIASHTVYKIKINDDHTLKLKARIAPHGNEDSSRWILRSDCSMCPPSGFRIIASIVSLRKWRITKIDVKTAFLQTGKADRDVYVVPPIESADRNRCLWLLLTASYRLVNANAKWQVMSDQTLIDIGFHASAMLPQLFYLQNLSGSTIAVLAKIVDDFLMCGESSIVDDVVDALGKRFTLGTIAHGPGELRYFGITVTQYDDYSVSINGDDKLNNINPAPITRVRRRDVNELLSPSERKVFASINSSIGWLGITVSPFCSRFSSLFQQDGPTATVASLCNQASRLHKLQQLGTYTYYGRPNDTNSHTPQVLMFCDAGRSAENGQICHLGGLLLDDICVGSTFHVITWASHKAHRPVRSTAAAETIAAGEGIDVGKTVAHVYSLLLQMHVDLVIVVDSKDLFTTLTTQRQSVDRSIRGDIGVIRFEFETRNVHKIIWIPGKLNFADVGTKFDSPMVDAVSQLLTTGKIPLSLDRSESCTSDKSLG